MHEAEIKGEFSRDQGKFWSIAEPESDTLTFADRGGRSRSVVAVFDPARSDYRLKIWLNGPQSPADFSFHGHVVTLAHRDRGFHTGAVDKAVLWKILQGQSPLEIDEDDEDDEDDLRDYCVETRFDLTRHSGRRAGHPGDVTDFPEWMRATAIVISQEDGGGSGPAVYLHTDLDIQDPDFADLLNGARINGVWMTGMPMAEGTKGVALFTPSPDEAAEIRQFGDGEIAEELPDGIRPPRTRHLIRQLWNFLKEHGGHGKMDAWQWRDDVMTLGYRRHGMGIAWGQRSFWVRKREDLFSRKAHWDDCLKRHFNKRQKAYANYTMDNWIDEVSGEPRKWRGYSRNIRAGISECDRKITHMTGIYDEQRAEYNERLERIEKREEKFADAISLIHRRESGG